MATGIILQRGAIRWASILDKQVYADIFTTGSTGTISTPKKEDSSGYYGYLQRTAKGRYAMGLHPGQRSESCVTVLARSYNMFNDPCWRKIRTVVDSGDMYYRGYHYSGFMYVK